jgi:integrase
MSMIHRLGPTALARKKEGLYCDGGGLYLQITRSRTDAKRINRSWIFRFQIPKPGGGYQARSMGLGSTDTVSLADAREMALEARKLRLHNVDPIEHRNAQRAAEAAKAAKTMTFDQCTSAYLAAHRAKWRGETSAYQWTKSLASYASPVIGKVAVQNIDLSLVTKVLEPIWHEKPETASRLRGRVETILDWATVRGFRQGDNPARWSGHLEVLFPSRRDLLPVKHFEAAPYEQVPAIAAALRSREGTAERALEFLILTATRTAEIIGAKWSEVDLAKKLWVIPGERMKKGKEHRVPLAPRPLAILAEMQELRRNDHVFPGVRIERLHDKALIKTLRRMGHDKTTNHGMRSAFRDWAAERTNYPREVVEAALAHANENKTEDAYKRTDFFEKRRKLMEAWATFCARPPQQQAGEFVPINSKAGAA